MEKKLFAEAMARIARRIEATTAKVEYNYTHQAHVNLVNDELFGGRFGLNRSTAAKYKDLAVLGLL